MRMKSGIYVLFGMSQGICGKTNFVAPTDVCKDQKYNPHQIML